MRRFQIIRNGKIGYTAESMFRSGRWLMIPEFASDTSSKYQHHWLKPKLPLAVKLRPVVQIL